MSEPVSTTTRLAPTFGVPIRALALEVVEGPEAGRHARADGDTLTVGTAESNTLVLTDSTVSRFHLELVRHGDGVRVSDLGSTNGTFVGEVRVERAEVPAGTILRLGRSAFRLESGPDTLIELHDGEVLSDIHARGPAMRRVMAQIARLAVTPVPVLVIGESGTGKELVARALHERGPRASGPFVTVDCGALAPSLVASELFGHERGAFTGADRRHVGAFERAHGGTLFLDEIGELPSDLQPQLLGALERRRFRRVGGRDEVEVDVRVVCATNRDLRAEVNSGRFRLDLYYRIAVVVLRIPALRERVEDIPLLVEHFLREAGYDGLVGDWLGPARLAELAVHPWPGNVRELRNWVEATLVMGEAAELGVGPDGQGPSGSTPPPAAALAELATTLPYKEARNLVLNEFEGRYLRALLERTRGNVSAASRAAGMDRSYLIKLLQKHQLRAREG